jgi:hypothetical protein
MDTQSIAKEAVAIAKAKYGKGWEHISNDAKIGASVTVVASNFKCYAPDAPASEVAAAVMAVVEMVVAESI